MITKMRFPLVLDIAAMAETRERESAVSLMQEDDFRAFYDRTARPLWVYLSRISGDRQQADDLLQEAYYRFYRAGTQYESESHRRNSLFRIATNLVRDAARRAKHRSGAVPLDEEIESHQRPVHPAALPEQQAAMRTDLQRALEQLDPLQREMLWLAYAQGASHEEIAGIVGVRAVSIRTMLLRARRKLAGLLDGVAAKPRAGEARS
jgi:RNA polymerase sigma-70 factor (ECF subfamily)